MHRRGHAEAVARIFVSLAALLPYWPLLTLKALFVTDDFFTSDIFNGELPGRVLLGETLRGGHWPVWTGQLCSGLSLAGSPADPLGLIFFALLRTEPALDLFLITLLLVAAHGAYSLARRFGADRFGSVLAGIAFSGSGYFACQLKHLSIVSTVAWLPLGLVLLDRAVAPTDDRGPSRLGRSFSAALFGLVFAEQVLSGFPQSAYICALVYGTFSVVGAMERRSWQAAGRALTTPLLAVLLGSAAGAIVLLPLWHLGQLSDRTTLGWEWLTRTAYWPPDVLTFLAPYANGDISNNTYRGPLLFWEDYGYVGLAPFLLAFYGGLRGWGQTTVKYVVCMSLVVYVFVLGPNTPVFRAAYLLVPGMSLFRFPTRFLVVVELGIALLGALGLTHFRRDLERTMPKRPRAGQLVALLICACTALDLFIHQPRQNPMVAGHGWLEAPASVAVVHDDASYVRTFTPDHRNYHRASFFAAHGWSNLAPYFAMRELLEPNASGAYWNTASADCYAGIAPSWYVDVWGDHNRDGTVMSGLAHLDFRRRALVTTPSFANALRTFGVTHVLSPYPETGAGLELAATAGHTYVYRVAGALRTRFVRAARLVSSDEEAANRLLARDFDPDGEILLHDAPGTMVPLVGSPAATSAGPVRAEIVMEDQRAIAIAVEAPSAGFLLLADTFFPGWTATVDGGTTPVYRANISLRGIAVPEGRHTVRFDYDPPGLMRGVWITGVSTSLLLLWAVCAAYVGRKRL